MANGKCLRGNRMARGPHARRVRIRSAFAERSRERGRTDWLQRLALSRPCCSRMGNVLRCWGGTVPEGRPRRARGPTGRSGKDSASRFSATNAARGRARITRSADACGQAAANAASRNRPAARRSCRGCPRRRDCEAARHLREHMPPRAHVASRSRHDLASCAWVGPA